MGKPRTPAGRARLAALRLAEIYPGSAGELCELDFSSPFELLVSTILSAQTTDVRVNQVVPILFARYPVAQDLAAARPGDVEDIIRSTGFFRAKTKSIMAMAEALLERFGGDVPHTMEELVTLPGVGRKTANVVLSVAFDTPGLPVDTHVTRLSGLLGLSGATDPVAIETELCALLARSAWGEFSLRLILHGRRVCVARRPRCADCVLFDFCPSADLGPGAPGQATRPRRPKSAPQRIATP